MNKNYILVGGGVLVILVGVLGFVFKRQIKQLIYPAPAVVTIPAPAVVAPIPMPTPNSTTAGEMIKETVVEKTDAGFSPSSVTIKKGTTVKFVNKSSTPMRVASVPHPVHTDYPEFDQKTNGDIFTFSFDKVGSWKYHNHSPFSSGGIITVTE